MCAFILHIYTLCCGAVAVAICSLVIELYLKDSVLELEKVNTEPVWFILNSPHCTCSK